MEPIPLPWLPETLPSGLEEIEDRLSRLEEIAEQNDKNRKAMLERRRREDLKWRENDHRIAVERQVWTRRG